MVERYERETINTQNLLTIGMHTRYNVQDTQSSLYTKRKTKETKKGLMMMMVRQIFVIQLIAVSTLPTKSDC